MKLTRVWIVPVVCVFAIGAAASTAAGRAAQEPPAFDQAKALADLQKAIAGKEELPAPEVFKNVTQYRGVTAGRLLRIMELGFSRSLGVTCTHCHVAGQWEKDDKTTKQIAREMVQMVASINGDLLKKIPNLRSTNPSVNCTTCHRGQTRPALDMPQTPAGRGGWGIY